MTPKQTEEQWEPVGDLPPIWKPTMKGEELVGHVVSVTQGSFGLTLIVSTTKGRLATPAHKVLQRKLEEINKGDMVRIVFNGNRPNKQGQRFRDYTVQRKLGVQA